MSGETYERRKQAMAFPNPTMPCRNISICKQATVIVCSPNIMLMISIASSRLLQLDLLRLSTGTQSRVITACTMLKRMLFRYQVSMPTSYLFRQACFVDGLPVFVVVHLSLPPIEQPIVLFRRALDASVTTFPVCVCVCDVVVCVKRKRGYICFCSCMRVSVF